MAVEDYRALRQNNSAVNEKDEMDAKQCAHEIHQATSAFENNDHERVIFYINAALQHTDQASDLLFMRAKSSLEVGDFYTTVSDTGKILKLHSSHLDAYQLRGDAYFHIGEFEAAANHYRQGLKYDPEHKGCKQGHKTLKSITKKAKRGDDASEEGNHDDALKYWSQAIEEAGQIDAFVRPTKMKMVKSYSATGNHDMAIRLALELLDEEETVDHYYVLGDAEMAAEKFDEAAKTFRIAFEKSVSSAVPSFSAFVRNIFVNACPTHTLSFIYFACLDSGRSRTKTRIARTNEESRGCLETKYAKELL